MFLPIQIRDSLLASTQIDLSVLHATVFQRRDGVSREINGLLAAFQFQRTLVKLAFHDHEISCPVTGICEPTGFLRIPKSRLAHFKCLWGRSDEPQCYFSQELQVTTSQIDKVLPVLRHTTQRASDLPSIAGNLSTISRIRGDGH